MKKKIILCLFAVLLMLSLTGCGQKEEQTNNNTNNNQQENTGKNEEEKKEKTNSVIIDDEIIEFDDEDNPPIVNETVSVKEIINCKDCVFAYFNKEGNAAKKLGDTITPEEYTTDIRTLKTAGGKQRHNFFGLVLSGSTISQAYACVLKDNNIYCIEGSTDGAYFSNNIGILDDIFTASKCKYLSNGNTYWCTDNDYSGDTQTSGYTSLHYETSCTIYGADANTGKLICH